MKIVIYEKKIQNSASYLFMGIGVILILSAIIFQCGAAQFLAGGFGLLLIIGLLSLQIIDDSKLSSLIQLLCILSLVVWAILTIVLWP